VTAWPIASNGRSRTSGSTHGEMMCAAIGRLEGAPRLVAYSSPISRIHRLHEREYPRIGREWGWQWVLPAF